MTGCICSERLQQWDEDGHCHTCKRDLRESQIQSRICHILTAGTGVVLWRNNIGTATYYDDNDKIASKVVYGVGNPGGADLIGGYRGRFLAIETKAKRGVQSKQQRDFQHVVENVIGGIYAIVRSQEQAKTFLAKLMAM